VTKQCGLLWPAANAIELVLQRNAPGFHAGLQKHYPLLPVMFFAEAKYNAFSPLAFVSLSVALSSVTSAALKRHPKLQQRSVSTDVATFQTRKTLAHNTTSGPNMQESL
jgi:hypothetical protein